MYDVLIAIDDDEARATAQARAVANWPGADGGLTAHLCHVFTDNPEGASVNQLASVRRAREALEDAGVAVVHHEASGEPGPEIVDAADDVDADAICVSGRKRRPSGKAVFGSVTQDVILSSDVPVFAVPKPTTE
ncbi:MULTISPECIES: universal stress protein [Haloferacaceae]|uniref:Universal stress protein n=1 Tax=Halorubrum glutamatedens TaxID=2707018 RepID=A0ABD5QQZ8_9EURY|nr:universal stress protein [Halobellus captivus]